MPKDIIDYSNTIIYKIYCKNETITDIYVGHTTNFFVRKYYHKNAFKNYKNDLQIYKTMRENGGWNNWNMIEIAKYNCKDSTEARIKEQLHYEELKLNTLNSCYLPLNVDNINDKNDENDILNEYTDFNENKDENNTILGNITIYDNELKNAKSFCDKKTPKNANEYECEKCDFKCSKKCDWERHIKRHKHLFLTNGDKQGTKKTPIFQSITKFTCELCEKEYTSRNGLWAHKKKCCDKNIKTILNDGEKQQQLVEYLLKENSEFKQLMIEQNKYMLEQNKNMFEIAKKANNYNSNNTINTTNSNNSFNLQFFLNETCKDAMNIMDFVGQLQVGIKDLEETGRLGYAEGISKIFINGLKQINISDRPLHCSDSKRETIYIRDKNQWSKENEEKSLLTNAIKHVAHKNMKQISEWTKINPEYKDSSSKQNDRYLKIVCESMCGSTKEETEKNYNKIIKNITKETVIDK